MVKKLFKHEIVAYLRLFVPLEIILLGVALLGRIVQFFEADTTAYSIVNVSSIIAYVVAILACVFISFIFSIVRFYRNMFTGEGYLTMTLPITTNQHLLVKVLTAALFQIINVVTMFLSLCLITAGDVMVEMFRAMGYLLARFAAEIGGHFYIYIAEGILLLLVALLTGFLLYYTCIAVGQLFNKNRILAAVGVYFAYYTATQILGTILVVLFSVLYDYLPIHAMVRFAEQNPHATIHIVLCGLLLFYAVLGVVYFLITRYIVNRRLNLE